MRGRGRDHAGIPTRRRVAPRASFSRHVCSYQPVTGQRCSSVRNLQCLFCPRTLLSSQATQPLTSLPIIVLLWISGVRVCPVHDSVLIGGSDALQQVRCTALCPLLSLSACVYFNRPNTRAVHRAGRRVQHQRSRLRLRGPRRVLLAAESSQACYKGGGAVRGGGRADNSPSVQRDRRSLNLLRIMPAINLLTVFCL